MSNCPGCQCTLPDWRLTCEACYQKEVEVSNQDYVDLEENLGVI